MHNLRVAMIAPPWLPIPPDGYGGIENVLKVLIPELRTQGVYVELFATQDSTIRVDKKHSLYKTGQYDYIHKPMYDTAPIQIAHIVHALNTIKKDASFDVIHDHNVYLGLLAYAYAGADIPPVVHTLHGPPFSTPETIASGIPDNMPMWREIGKTNRTFIVGISRSLMRDAPRQLTSHILPPVYNAVDVSQFPFVDTKQDYFITLARFHPDKGQAIAVKTCLELGLPLKMAGVVGDLSTEKHILLELANPSSTYRGLADFRYFSDHIFPHLHDSGLIEYVGEMRGDKKLQFISKAKALLFPIQWDEPFGMVVIEALACGTPVVTMARGAMPEIIEHGKNGFLANSVSEFKKYVQRIDEIDPAECRASVERYFSAETMAKEYIKRYGQAIAKS